MGDARNHEEFSAQYDAAIEPVIETLQKFARLHQKVCDDMLTIDCERFLACWIAQILWEVGIDLERAVGSLHEDNLTLHDDANIQINDAFRHFQGGPRAAPFSSDRRNPP